MKRSQSLYCIDILERIARIESYTSEGRDAFMRSKVLQDGTIHCFVIIGEVLKRLDPEMLAKHPQIVWREIAGFRDMLVHQYHRIDLEVVWDAVCEDLPALKTVISAILKDLEAGD